MKLEFVLRFGYALVVISLILMIWTSLAGAIRKTSSPDEKHPPCYFNPLCSCSRAVPDLGVVRCQDILLPRIPETINTSRVYMLHLDNNGLRTLEPYFLQSTGVYGLSITNNYLALIPDEAFLGLERSLWELDLSYNRLIQIPSRAIRYLRKLKFLDLTGNDISAMHSEHWKGLENLERLFLADNSLTHLSSDALTGLPLLDTIDLRGNNLKEIDPSIFRDGMDRLAHIIFADNQLTSIPYLALAPLKMLRTLDLSYNRITKMKTTETDNLNVQLDFKLSLDVLRLDYNQITLLETGAFHYFLTVNQTYLDGNTLENIQENAFRQARIRELYIRDCGLTEIAPAAFGGLENYLQVLDLSGNSLANLEQEIFHRFDVLRVLSLEDNLLNVFNPMEAFNSFQFSLTNLDLSGRMNAAVNTQSLQNLKNLRQLRLSNIQQTTLSEENFRGYGIDLEELSLTSGNIQSIKNRAFQHVHSLRTLDFSENSISQMEGEAFSDLDHSLISLKCSHGLSNSLSTFPFESLRSLLHLEDLDFSNNKLRDLPDTSFHFMKNLRHVELQDNEIDTLRKGTFQGDIHSQIVAIYLSFNSLNTIQQHTFTHLDKLEQIHLDDNRINNIDRKAFMHLKNLKRINLKGNKVTSVSYEAFQNLPELEDLDLSYNQLTDFQFSMFDQVGTLSAFRVNISHNQIRNLELNGGGGEFGDTQSNIKYLDLSFNNITRINYQFFKPIELSLTHLFIGHNSLFNATKDVFGHMPHLQWLDLSFNRLLEIDYDTFRNTKNLQVVNISHNHVAEIPKDIFRSTVNLRVADFSHNRLRFLPDNLFNDEGLEVLNMAHNQLSRVPLSSMTASAASSLCDLDLSFNGISAVSHGEIFSKFKVLSRLDLSYNKLVQVDAGVLGFLPRLSHLDLSHNKELVLERNGRSFLSLDDTLIYLGLSNISLTYVPELPLPNLISLSLSNNYLPTIPPEMASNLSSLRNLNLAHNDLTSVPIVTHSLDFLKRLSLAGNPITSLTNTSLLGVADYLEELDITKLNLNIFETGALSKLHFMKILKITVYEHVKDFNIPRVLEWNFGLRELFINIDHETNLQNEMKGDLLPKVRSITFNGVRLKSIASTVLECVESPTLHVTFENTGITRVYSSLFEDLKYVRNISLDIYNNNQMQFFENPSTGYKLGASRRTFLTDLSISGNQWNCDCDLGWIEVWHRKRRQYICGTSPSNPASIKSPEYNCRHVEDELREARCSNKMNQSLVEIFKMEIECGWSSAPMITNSKQLLYLIFAAVLFALI